MNCTWDWLTPQLYVYCEKQLCGFWQQPANVFSNLAYFLVALLIFLEPEEKKQRWFFAFGSGFLSISSMFFHLSGSRIGMYFDVFGMFLLAGGLFQLTLNDYLKRAPSAHLIIVSSTLLLCLFLSFVFQLVSAYLALIVGASVMLELLMIRDQRSALNQKEFLAAIAFGFMGLVFLVVDLKKIWCDPDNHFINGHALWHVSSAIAIYLGYLARFKTKNPPLAGRAVGISKRN